MSVLLAADIGVLQPGFRLDVAFGVARGEVLAILGPNGAGKTTILRALAGFCPIDRGSITLQDRPLDDPERRVFVRPEKRSIGYVFQEYRLFPWLTALDNVAFGLRQRKMSKEDARRSAATWLERFDVADAAEVKAGQLSGGQAQRVALARALAPRPGVLLLDEPMAALDAEAKPMVRTDLRRHLIEFGGASILVTHDPIEAGMLADRLIVVESGRIVQEGSPDVVAARPATDYVARLVGLNLFRGTVTASRMSLAGGGELTVPSPQLAGDCLAAIRPEDIRVFAARPEGNRPNQFAGRVTSLVTFGGRMRLVVESKPRLVVDITMADATDLDLEIGSTVWLAIDPDDVRAYPAATPVASDTN